MCILTTVLIPKEVHYLWGISLCCGLSLKYPPQADVWYVCSLEWGDILGGHGTLRRWSVAGRSKQLLRDALALSVSWFQTGCRPSATCSCHCGLSCCCTWHDGLQSSDAVRQISPPQVSSVRYFVIATQIVTLHC